jgi:hypothetical protein
MKSIGISWLVRFRYTMCLISAGQLASMGVKGVETWEMIRIGASLVADWEQNRRCLD